MAQLFINIVGHNSAGKSHLAKKLAEDLGFEIISGDDFRLFVYEHFRYYRKENLGRKSPRNDQLNRFLTKYREGMMEILLSGGQNVIMDGSGANKEIRSGYLEWIDKNYPNVKALIIHVVLDEPELLKRLAKRDQQTAEKLWVDVYQNVRKELFQPPTQDEAPVFIYNQTNYDEVVTEIKTLLET